MRAAPVEVPVSLRPRTNKGGRKQLRASGKVPAVIYGRGLAENLLVAVEERFFLHELPETAWHATPMKLVVQDPGYADFTPTVVAGEVQRNIVTGHLLSVDFHVVSAEEKVHVQVPVVHVGESPGVRRGGILEHLVHEVTVASTLADLPEQFEVDLSTLALGDRVRASDLAVPPGVELLEAPEEVILLIAAPRTEVEEAAPAAEGAVVAETPQPERARPEEKEA